MYQRLITIAGGMTLGSAALLAQVTGGGIGGQNFQQADTMVRPTTAVPVMRAIGTPPIAGMPFSGTEERHTSQTLGDGTVLESSETSILYRDNDGRTRTERTAQGRTIITIVDPIAHTSVRLDPSTKTATKMTTVAGFGGGAGGGLRGGLATTTADKAAYEAGVVAAARGGNMPVATTAPSAEAKLALDDLQKKMAEMQAQQETNTRTHSEDLGMMHQNGVQAQGSRSTLTIPVGQIGNNREIKVVNERWYSQELQMTVKSINSDPRFGTTTYDLRNISRSNPPLSFFQIPSDYTVQEGGGRGGAVTAMPVRKQ
jgi:hypothetical protein